MNPSALYFEIGQNSLKIVDDDEGLELPLERLDSGKLSPSCREKLSVTLREFLKKRHRGGRQPALCAIGARGVSLRRLTLPASPKDEFERQLLLQIEAEFPLAPDELAWGYRRLSQIMGNGSPAAQELLVAAVKKDLLEDYSECLGGCGLTPSFTLGALTRGSLCAQAPPNYAILDIGRNQSELISFENGAPALIRIIPWGGENITRAIEKTCNISRDQAEQLKIESNPTQASQKVKAVVDAEALSLAAALKPAWLGEKLYLAGKTSLLKDFSAALSKSIGQGIACERLYFVPHAVSSSAIAGLRSPGSMAPLILQTRKSHATEASTGSGPIKWIALAAVLLFASLSLRYAEGFLQEKRLARKVSEINAYKERLPRIDRELSFLQYVQTNQPPYMDAILTIASAMPGGLRIDSLSMNRRGEVSLRGSMRDSQQIIDFRTKLIDSGFFSTVVVEEQTPTPDRQKVNYRITGQWKPSPERKAPPTPEPQPAKLPAGSPKIGTPSPIPMPPPAFPQ